MSREYLKLMKVIRIITTMMIGRATERLTAK
jgi:hypothetical protein